MKEIFRTFPLALKMILTDPVNFILAVVPTLIALFVYVLSITGIYRNSDMFVAFFQGYVYTSSHAMLLSQLLTGVLIIFVFFVMSWTFVLVVGIVVAPFNSLLSARIEQKLVQRVLMDEDQGHALAEVKRSLGATFKNEFKKLFSLAVAGGFAFVLNLFPLFYPMAVFLIATLLAVQFVDYSWSRHDLSVGQCLADVARNIVPYSVSGMLFLVLVPVPIVNAFVPAVATSYYTILWVRRFQHTST
jgi:CysZ protein